MPAASSLGRSFRKDALANEPRVRNYAAFTLINHLFSAADPPDHTQPQLLRALAELPGIHDGGTVDDGTGADAIVIGWDADVNDDAENWTFTQRPQILLDADTQHYFDGWWRNLGVDTDIPLPTLAMARPPGPSRRQGIGTVTGWLSS